MEYQWGIQIRKGLIAAMSDTSQSSSSSNNSAGTHDNGNASEFGGEGEIPNKEGHQSSVNNNNTTNNSGSRTTHARGGEGQYREIIGIIVLIIIAIITASKLTTTILIPKSYPLITLILRIVWNKYGKIQKLVR